MSQVNIQELEAKLTKLRTHRAQSQELGLPTDTIDARIAELASQLNAAQISISGSPHAQQIIGNDNVQIYIDQYIGSDNASVVRTMFNKYLSDIWGPLIRLPMMVIAERKADDKEVPLTAVYTELNVTVRVGVGKQKGLISSEGRAGIQGLQDDPEQLKRILVRVGREAKEANGDETYRRQVTALEAVAAAPRMVLPTQLGRALCPG